MRWALVLALLWGSAASAQVTHSPFILSVAAGGGAGGIAGVEEACSTSGLYGSGGNCVCSEPMDVSHTVTNTASNDFPDSPNTHECWGAQRTGTQGFGSDNTNSTADVSSRAGWGSATYALEVNDAASTWALIPVDLITSSTRSLCIRWYQDVDDTYASAGSNGGDCPSSNWRNKVFEMMYASGSTLIQGEERSDGGCSTSPNFKPIDFYVVDEDVTGGGERYPLSPSVDWNDLDEAPARFEACIDGNILAGTNLQVRMKVTSLEGGGPSGSSVSDVFDGGASGGAPTNKDIWGGDWWHSGNLGGTESSRRGYFSVWAWDTDADDWPGAACEIEGGC